MKFHIRQRQLVVLLLSIVVVLVAFPYVQGTFSPMCCSTSFKPSS